MLIRTKLTVVSWVTVAMAILFMLIFAWNKDQLRRTRTQSALLNEITQTAFKRTALRDEFMLNYDERPKQQWKQQTERLSDLLQQVQSFVNDPEEIHSLHQTQYYFDKTRKSFAQILLLREKSSQKQFNSIQKSELEKRLYYQLILDAQSFLTQLILLEDYSQNLYNKAQSRSNLIMFSCVFAITLITLIMCLAIARSISNPLKRLNKAVEALSTGNLQHRVTTESNDEIGQLSRAFDNMTQNLDKTTVSRDKLADEVKERKRYEEELKQKNSELERFVYTVSHDLKSPLVTISTFLTYLQQDMDKDDKPRIQQDMAYMRSAADKMEILLAELLELFRAGIQKNKQEQISLKDIYDETLQLVAGHISQRNAVVICHDNNLTLHGDRIRLIEIWQNLVENAVKYMGEQPDPKIELGNESIDGQIVFFVRDNGTGIEKKYHENIFGLFNKLHAASEGSGLGLALVKRIVETYEGRIWVESEGLGKGSCFRFTLPEALKNNV